MQTKVTELWIVYSLLCFNAASTQDVVVIEGPQDRAVLSEQNAELTCHINISASGESHVAQWVGNSIRTGAGRPISVNDRVTATDLPNKFLISKEKPYNLHINITSLEDAGKYTCNNVNTGKPIGGLEPQLVVLDPAPCPLSDTTTTTENETISFEWSIRYAGHRNDSQKPNISWTFNGAEHKATVNDTTEGQTRSTFSKKATSADDQKILNLTLKVLNIEEYCFTRLNVLFPARKPIISVNGRTVDQTVSRHTVGENIKLMGTSKGNPKPTITWQYNGPGDTGFDSEHLGDTNEINNIQINQTGIYRCCARNNLNGYRECSKLEIQVVTSGSRAVVEVSCITILFVQLLIKNDWL